MKTAFSTSASPHATEPHVAEIHITSERRLTKIRKIIDEDRVAEDCRTQLTLLQTEGTERCLRKVERNIRPQHHRPDHPDTAYEDRHTRCLRQPVAGPDDPARTVPAAAFH